MRQKIYFNAMSESEYYIEKLCEWLQCKEMQELVTAFGGQNSCDISKNTLNNLKRLVEFSDIWNYRQRIKQAGGERWQINSETFTQQQMNCIEAAVDALGLRGIQYPNLKDYDYIIALGGARMSCLYRTKYAYKFLGEKASAQLVLLSSLRKIMDSERTATNTYAPEALTEFELMNAALRKVTVIQNVKKTEHIDINEYFSWKIIEGEDANTKKRISSIAAPSRNKECRANTADTYAFFFEKEQQLQGKSVLLVTSQIYVPYQHIEAVRMIGIPYKMNIDTVGYPVEWNESTGKQSYENYLQEIRSMIQAVYRLGTITIK